MFGFKKVAMPKAAEALPGRAAPIRTAATHFINHRPLKGPYPEGIEKAHVRARLFLGCGAQVLGTRRRASTSLRLAMPAA